MVTKLKAGAMAREEEAERAVNIQFDSDLSVSRS